MVKLPIKCEHCGEENYHYARCSCQNGVDDSCGCIFCDLGLDPDVEIEGAKFHHVTRRGNILCERAAEPKHMAAFRYDRLIQKPER